MLKWDFTLGTEPTIGFEEISYIFEEGTIGEVCITVDCVLEGTTAIAILSYIPFTASMYVPMCACYLAHNVGRGEGIRA